MRRWLPLRRHLSRHVHAPHRRHDRERRPARHGASTCPRRSRPCSGSSTSTRSCWPRCCSAPARCPTSSGAGCSTSAGLVVFALASLASGASQNPTELIVARAVQGFGAAAMFATTIALINASYGGSERGIAYGVWGAVSGAGGGDGADRRRRAHRAPVVAVDLLRQPARSRSWPSRWRVVVLDGSRGEHKARLDPARAGLVHRVRRAAHVRVHPRR